MDAVVLFTRDLRVHDQPALAAATRAAERVLPLFVLDDGLTGSPNRTASSSSRSTTSTDRCARSALGCTSGAAIPSRRPCESPGRPAPGRSFCPRTRAAYAQAARGAPLREHPDGDVPRRHRSAVRRRADQRWARLPRLHPLLPALAGDPAARARDTAAVRAPELDPCLELLDGVRSGAKPGGRPRRRDGRPRAARAVARRWRLVVRRRPRRRRDRATSGPRGSARTFTSDASRRSNASLRARAPTRRRAVGPPALLARLLRAAPACVPGDRDR